MERTRLFTLAVCFLLFVSHYSVAQTVTKDAPTEAVEYLDVESEAATDEAVEKRVESDGIKIPLATDGADYDFSDSKKAKGEYVFPSFKSFVPTVHDTICTLVEPYFQLQKIELGTWVKEGIVLMVNTTDSEQIHIVNRPMDVIQPLTTGQQMVHSTGATAADGMVVFYKDNVGKGVSFVSMLDMLSGKITTVSDKSFDSWFIVKSHDEKTLAWCTAFDGMDYDVFVGPKDSVHLADVVYDNDGLTMPLCFSPDGKRLVVSNLISYSQSYLHIVNLEDTSSKRLTPITDTIYHDSDAHWLSNSDEFLVLSTWRSDLKRLTKISAKTNEYKALSTEEMGETTFLDYHVESNSVLIITNQKGTSKLYVDIGKGGDDLKEVLLPEPNSIRRATFSRDGKEIAFDMGLSNTPRDIYTFHLSTYKLDRWTKAYMGALNTDNFVTPTMIQYPTFDKDTEGKQRMIDAVYYKPDKNKFGDGPYPVLIDLHGGPVGQATLSFNPQMQMLVNELGIAILQPNFRGSSGRGTAFEQLDNGIQREDVVTDVEYLLNWIDKAPELDGSRIAMTGTSYGGWLVNYCMTRFGYRISAAISTSGFCDIPHLLKDTDAKKALESEFGDLDKGEYEKFFRYLSPINFTKSVESPMLIIHGKNDLTVPVDQAEMWYRALTKRGANPWLLLFDHEGHQIKSRENQIKMYEVIVMFLTEHLLSGNEKEVNSDSERD